MNFGYFNSVIFQSPSQIKIKTEKGENMEFKTGEYCFIFMSFSVGVSCIYHKS